ncbi:GntR family transcriptional regulator [Alkalicella caledoniensis]|uniref:GntR family transcriptional regulator n=1 Tax=Alkalicella caledoniensis TaxID=2731377 RepID=A0A7G9WA60_ALKCA|nr:GntR family transcriptional regulator [Alkalicella caledoniensis]QNO15572.1 GntR family transcriptional regulator [Alkalicella caledoniensis]
MDILISTTGSKPIYVQIAEQIQRQILTGELKEGSLLPSIRVLAKELHISVMTSKTAYQELEIQGLIHSVQGKGFYVSPQNTETLEDKKSDLIAGKLEELAEEAKALGIELEQLVKILKRVY